MKNKRSECLRVLTNMEITPKTGYDSSGGAQHDLKLAHMADELAAG